jgi:hypothetical protein
MRNSDSRAFAWLLVLFAVATDGVQAQDATFDAKVDKNPVALGDQFTLSLTLSSTGLSGGKNLQLPDLGKFRVMSGPNQSSSVQFINGAVSSAVTYSYILQAKEIGKFTIGPASIEAGGKKYSSAPTMLEVVKAIQRQKQAPGVADNSPPSVGDNLILRAVADRTHVMQGEQVAVTFKLYYRVRLARFYEPVPTMPGFWSEDLEVPTNVDPGTETLDGKQFRVSIVKRMALFASQAGNLEVGPAEAKVTALVQPRSNDPFDSFFFTPFSQSVDLSVKSEPIKIRVDPLPPGAPDDFKGAVGQFAMSTDVDKKTTRTNEPVSLRVKISGQGNIKLLESPTIDLPTDFEQYSPKVSETIERKGEKISGSKNFEFLLIPRYPGLKVIKPVTFSYYDIAKHEYVRLRSPQIELNVEQGAATPAPLIAGATREDVRLLSQDIRFIKITPATFLRKGDELYSSGVFIVLLLLPLAGMAGAFVYARQRQAVMADEAGYRNRRAIKVAQRGLKEAEYLLHEKSGPQGSPSSLQRVRFYSEVSKAIWKYLGDKLNIPQSDFSVEGAITELKDHSVETGLCHALRVLLESCDMARFAPTSLELPAMQKTYDEAKRLIVELERVLKSR